MAKTTKLNSISAALRALKKGRPVIVIDDENRENEGDLVLAGEHVTAKMVNFFAREARGLICTPVTAEIADRLGFTKMCAESGEQSACNFTISCDAAQGISSGISASDRALTIKKIAASKTQPQDFVRPGHVFPLRAKEGGVLVRAGHTEAAIDLAKLAGLKPVGMICEIMKSDGTMARLPDLLKFAQQKRLKIVSIADLIAYRLARERLVTQIATAKLPTKFGEFTVYGFRNQLCPQEEHLALVAGKVRGQKNVLVRVHSECLTSDVFGSLRCDCREQKEAALKKIAAKKQGVFLFLRQEGRGIGLCNKIQAYGLQDLGIDTVEANQQLGFAADERNYGIGAQILAALGLSSIQLLTNNPLKLKGLAGFGIKVTKRIPLEIVPHAENRAYLATKKKRLGHCLKKI